MEVVEMMRRRKMDVLCVQETKWKGDRARTMAEGHNMLHAGGDGRSNGSGIIVNVEISKEVVRVERWHGRIIAVWMMIRQKMVCGICVYGHHTGRTEAEKEAFREEVERLARLSDGQTMLCVAGDFNALLVVVEPGNALLVVVEPGNALLVVVEPGNALLVVVEPGNALLVVVEPGNALLVVVEPENALLVVVEPGNALLVVVEPGNALLVVVEPGNALLVVVEPGDEESIGRFGWRTRNREGRELVEMLRRNGLVVAGTFFQKKESQQITYRSGHHKTELDLLVVRQQQLRRVKTTKHWHESMSPHSTNRSSLRSA